MFPFHEILCFFTFFQALKYVKTAFVHGPYKSRCWVELSLQAIGH